MEWNEKKRKDVTFGDWDVFFFVLGFFGFPRFSYDFSYVPLWEMVAFGAYLLLSLLLYSIVISSHLLGSRCVFKKSIFSRKNPIFILLYVKIPNFA
jgi:hypothetical protein